MVAYRINSNHEYASDEGQKMEGVVEAGIEL